MHVCLHTACVPSVLGGQKWVPDSLELELWMVISHHVGAGNKLGSSAGTKGLNQWAISKLTLEPGLIGSKEGSMVYSAWQLLVPRGQNLSWTWLHPRAQQCLLDVNKLNPTSCFSRMLGNLDNVTRYKSSQGKARGYTVTPVRPLGELPTVLWCSNDEFISFHRHPVKY